MLPIPPQQLKDRLVAEGLITTDQFDALAAEAERKAQDLFDVLASARIADTGYLRNVVAEIIGVPLANLGSTPVNEEALRALPEPIARERRVILFNREPDGTYDAAMADPGDLASVEFLSQRLQARVKPFLATGEDLDRGFVLYGRRSTEGFKKTIGENVQQSLQSGKTGEDAAAEVPIVAIVDNVLSYAVSSRASDIHVEALEDSTIIRERIDGMLYEMIRIPREVHNAIVARLKILSGLKIDEHYKPQDGRFRYAVANQVVDVRVSVMPTAYGEKVEARLLESAQKPLSLEELGMLPETAAIVTKALQKAYGMIIICGPTGSGKSTTLYALINILNRPNVNVVSIEDPIEYNMRFVNQSQISPQAGVTFASGLRALLRQDPNIIMVGEIRDGETAQVAVQAALTGHLLLSSLHTNDAPGAVPRLFDLGVPSFLVASTLNLVFAQRLVRRVCTACVQSYEPVPEVLAAVREQLKTLGVPDAEAILPKTFYRGKGCAVCGGIGYRGRLGIFEVALVTEGIKNIIISPAFDLTTLKREARTAGMRTMFEDGLEKAGLGLTTVEEVLLVIRE